MIRFKSGDIVMEKTEAVVNTVNCVGVMGRGIALQFKKAYPENFKVYARECKEGNVQPGYMFVFETGQALNPKYIINFPTKRHWRAKSKIEDIESGLKDLVNVLQSYNIKSIAIPPVGCGLGGLNWGEIKPLIVNALNHLAEVEVFIYEPVGQPKTIFKSSKLPNLTPGRAALVSLIHGYLSGLLDTEITLLELHKLMYFMQEAGEPLKLNFKKALYGPYAGNLRHVLNVIEGHFISGFSAGGEEPGKRISLVSGAIEASRTTLESQKDTKKHFDRVMDLVEGFETPVGLELISTVHWVLKMDSPISQSEVIDKVYQWNRRKKQFSTRQIEVAFDHLIDKGWAKAIGAVPNTKRGIVTSGLQP